MNQIIWSPRATDAYLDILEITYYFSVSAALDLDEKLEKLVNRLQKHKYSCPPSKLLPGTRRCVVTKNVSLVYEIVGDVIQIILVIDNRMDNLV